MEYCGGTDFFVYLSKRGFKLDEKRAAEIIFKISSAIFYLHSFGIAHRDLKPENIMMTDSKDTADIRILDFGLSKFIGPGQTCTEPFGTLVLIKILNTNPYYHHINIYQHHINNLVLRKSRSSSKETIR